MVGATNDKGILWLLVVLHSSFLLSFFCQRQL